MVKQKKQKTSINNFEPKATDREEAQQPQPSISNVSPANTNDVESMVESPVPKWQQVSRVRSLQEKKELLRKENRMRDWTHARKGEELCGKSIDSSSGEKVLAEKWNAEIGRKKEVSELTLVESKIMRGEFEPGDDELSAARWDAAGCRGEAQKSDKEVRDLENQGYMPGSEKLDAAQRQSEVHHQAVEQADAKVMDLEQKAIWRVLQKQDELIALDGLIDLHADGKDLNIHRDLYRPCMEDESKADFDKRWDKFVEFTKEPPKEGSVTAERQLRQRNPELNYAEKQPRNKKVKVESTEKQAQNENVEVEYADKEPQNEELVNTKQWDALLDVADKRWNEGLVNDYKEPQNEGSVIADRPLRKRNPELNYAEKQPRNKKVKVESAEKQPQNEEKQPQNDNLKMESAEKQPQNDNLKMESADKEPPNEGSVIAETQLPQRNPELNYAEKEPRNNNLRMGNNELRMESAEKHLWNENGRRGGFDKAWDKFGDADKQRRYEGLKYAELDYEGLKYADKQRRYEGLKYAELESANKRIWAEAELESLKKRIRNEMKETVTFVLDDGELQYEGLTYAKLKSAEKRLWNEMKETVRFVLDKEASQGGQIPVQLIDAHPPVPAPTSVGYVAHWGRPFFVGLMWVAILLASIAALIGFIATLIAIIAVIIGFIDFIRRRLGRPPKTKDGE